MKLSDIPDLVSGQVVFGSDNLLATEIGTAAAQFSGR